jgi:hypothetical protein
MPKPTTEQRLTEFLRCLSDGFSIRLACNVCGVSQRTVWLRRKNYPPFDVAVDRALCEGKEIRAEWREEDFRERWIAPALERADRDDDYDERSRRDRFPCKVPRSERPSMYTRKERRLYYRWRGEWLDSQMPQGKGWLAQQAREALRAKMQADFSAARARKGKPPRQPKPEPAPEPGRAPPRQRGREPAPPAKKGWAGVLW